MSSARCEPARWALDYAACPYVVRSLLVGPHTAQLAALTRQTQVPALTTDSGVRVGTRAIVEAVALLRPDRPLLPADPTARAATLGFTQGVEETLGEPLEVLWLSALLANPDYACALFAMGRGPTRRRLYRTLFPGVRAALLAQHRRFSPEVLSQARARVRTGLDRVAAGLEPGGPLAGEMFDLGKLVAAGLLSWLVPAAECPYRLPSALPPELLALRTEFGGHAAVGWAAGAYRRHRGVSMAENHEIEGSGVL